MINRIRKSPVGRYLTDLLGGTIVALGFEREEGPIAVPDANAVQLITTIATLPAGLLAADARIGMFAHADILAPGGEVPGGGTAQLLVETDVVSPLDLEAILLAGILDTADQSQCSVGYLSAAAGDPNVPNPTRTVTVLGANPTAAGPYQYTNINLFWFVLSS